MHFPQIPPRWSRRLPAAAQALLAATGLGILYGFWPQPFLRPLTALAVAATAVTLWPHLRAQTRRLALLFLLVTVGTAFWAPPDTVLEGAVRSAEVIALLFSVQVLADAVSYGGYDRTVRHLLAGVHWRRQWVALAGGYVLSWTFLLTSIPVVYTALTGQGRNNGNAGAGVSGLPPPVPDHHADLGVLLARAFSVAAVATPLQPTVLLAVAVAGAPMVDFLKVAVPLSLLMLPLALVGIRTGGAAAGVRAPAGSAMDQAAIAVGDAEDDGTETGTGAGDPAEVSIGAPGEAGLRGGEPGTGGHLLLVGFFLTLGAAVTAVAGLQVSVLSALALAVCLVSVVFGYLGGRAVRPRGGRSLGDFRALGRDYVGRLADGVMLVAMGAVAGFTLTHTPAMPAVGDFLRDIQSPLLAAALVIGILVLLRLAGVVPAVILVTVGPVLAGAVTLSDVALAVLLSAGATLAFVLSPFSMTTAIVVSLTGRSAVEVGLTRQAPFVLLGTVVTLAYVLLAL